MRKRARLIISMQYDGLRRMIQTPQSLPELVNAPLQHEFHQFNDYIGWVRGLFGVTNHDCLTSDKSFHSLQRSVNLGTVHLGWSQYSSGMRLTTTIEQKLLVTFNHAGMVGFRVGKQKQTPPAHAGVIVTSPTEGHYLRGPGGGLWITTSPQTLIQTAQAMYGPPAGRQLQDRLIQPLHFHSFSHGPSAPMARGLSQAVRMVDSMMAPDTALPAALRLDDLLSRQLVLMICPELGERSKGQARPSGSLDMLLEWMVAHLREPLSLSELERQSGYSRRSLQRAFQERFGCGPMQWLRKRRLEQALTQLTNPQPRDTVSLIAQRCGYLSLSSFSRDFNQHYGQQPSAMLRSGIQSR